jgi:CO/xanthine dehydrogenase Mo-binding subunit
MRPHSTEHSRTQTTKGLMAHGSSSEQAAMPLGLVGVGEVDITGAAAVASAVYHATGRRIREPPITLDKLL